MAGKRLHINLYSRKQRWKIVLFLLALGIVAASLAYSNLIVNKIRTEERKKIELWAEAIQKKAKLVRYTSELFDKLRKEERKKVDLMADAWKVLAQPSFLDDYTFITKVIGSNTTVPVIIVDDKGFPLFSRNLDSLRSKDATYLAEQLAEMKDIYEPIEFPISKSGNQYLYYRDSKLFSELQRVMQDLIRSFISEVVLNSASVPVIYTDANQETVIDYGNIDSTLVSDPLFIAGRIRAMRSQNEPIKVDLGDGVENFIFYEDSILLTQLKYYPYVVLFFISIFLLISYLLFSTFRKAEQNQVWVGMAKETAHQLGTPLSSLLAWVEIFREKDSDNELVDELEKDVKRLETITERFSKIGSQSNLIAENIQVVLEQSIQYLRNRVSQKVSFTIQNDSGKEVFALINLALFEWVIENLCKNGVDAMEGQGSIHIAFRQHGNSVHIDVTDSGKGVPPSKQKTIFEPGYTTKKTGWGLGLTLVKRIIENYHKGKIFVKSSEAEKGTTFRIVLKSG